ncbi:MAG: hypothetical protein ACRENJ_06605 [Candidatus Eiseniibacteriota bacterium]
MKPARPFPVGQQPNRYQGRPTNSQLRYADVLEGEMAVAQKTFDALTGKELITLNAGLITRKVDPVKTLSHEEETGEELTLTAFPARLAPGADTRTRRRAARRPRGWP